MDNYKILQDISTIIQLLHMTKARKACRKEESDKTSRVYLFAIMKFINQIETILFFLINFYKIFNQINN